MWAFFCGQLRRKLVIVGDGASSRIGVGLIATEKTDSFSFSRRMREDVVVVLIRPRRVSKGIRESSMN
jgi:hypothetical protein